MEKAGQSLMSRKPEAPCLPELAGHDGSITSLPCRVLVVANDDVERLQMAFRRSLWGAELIPFKSSRKNRLVLLGK